MPSPQKLNDSSMMNFSMMETIRETDNNELEGELSFLRNSDDELETHEKEGSPVV
jgi:hypothetical protein